MTNCLEHGDRSPNPRNTSRSRNPSIIQIPAKLRAQTSTNPQRGKCVFQDIEVTLFGSIAYWPQRSRGNRGVPGLRWPIEQFVAPRLLGYHRSILKSDRIVLMTMIVTCAGGAESRTCGRRVPQTRCWYQKNYSRRPYPTGPHKSGAGHTVEVKCRKGVRDRDWIRFSFDLFPKLVQSLVDLVEFSRERRFSHEPPLHF